MDIRLPTGLVETPRFDIRLNATIPGTGRVFLEPTCERIEIGRM